MDQATVTRGKPGFLDIALEPSVRRRALRIALVVGSVLAVINHGDRMLMLSLDAVAVLKIFLTFLVPYSVSTYSSVLAVRDQRQKL